MLKVRIIPTLLCKEFGLVKGKQFDSARRVGAVLPAINVYNKRKVDELLVMDVMASRHLTPPDEEAVADFSAACFVPLTVGGGITSLEDIQKLLHAGADKVLINTAAYENPGLIEKAAACFGSQCIVAGIDAKKEASGAYACYSHAGERLQSQTPQAWAKTLADCGAGEIVITSIDRDGTLQGYDLPLIESVVEAVSIPVIASGGAGCYQDFYEAIQKGAAAVAAASLFHFTEQTPQGAKAALAALGIAVRKNFPEEAGA